jgi:hypothetical protein
MWVNADVLELKGFYKLLLVLVLWKIANRNKAAADNAAAIMILGIDTGISTGCPIFTISSDTA